MRGGGSVSAPTTSTPPLTTPTTTSPPTTTQTPTPSLSITPTKTSTPTPLTVELKYDDGTRRDSLSTTGGHIVDYSPPSTPFTITKIRIAGVLSSSATGITGKTFDLQILDKDLKVLYSETYPYTKFTTSVTWVEFEIPNIEVADKFYVHLYTESPRFGLHIGADDSVINEHSDVTIRNDDTISILAAWPYSSTLWFGDKSKVNWMIRVTGTYMAPAE
jgi:hypothetical protein